MHLSLDHIGIPCSDLEKSISFYNSLGFSTTEKRSEPNKVAFLSSGNLVLEIYQCPQVVKKPGAIDHLALMVDDIDKAFSELQSKYDFAQEEIQYLPFKTNGVKFFKIYGPDREVIELIQSL